MSNDARNSANAGTEQATPLPSATVHVADVAVTARKLFPDGLGPGLPPIPTHDWRIVVTTDQGHDVTFHRGATADDVAAWCKREGWTLPTAVWP